VRHPGREKGAGSSNVISPRTIISIFLNHSAASFSFCAGAAKQRGDRQEILPARCRQLAKRRRFD
jgi:hypothetical protein